MSLFDTLLQQAAQQQAIAAGTRPFGWDAYGLNTMSYDPWAQQGGTLDDLSPMRDLFQSQQIQAGGDGMQMAYQNNLSAPQPTTDPYSQSLFPTAPTAQPTLEQFEQQKLDQAMSGLGFQPGQYTTEMAQQYGLPAAQETGGSFMDDLISFATSPAIMMMLPALGGAIAGTAGATAGAAGGAMDMGVGLAEMGLAGAAPAAVAPAAMGGMESALQPAESMLGPQTGSILEPGGTLQAGGPAISSPVSAPATLADLSATSMAPSIMNNPQVAQAGMPDAPVMDVPAPTVAQQPLPQPSQPMGMGMGETLGGAGTMQPQVPSLADLSGMSSQQVAAGDLQAMAGAGATSSVSPTTAAAATAGVGSQLDLSGLEDNPVPGYGSVTPDMTLDPASWQHQLGNMLSSMGMAASDIQKILGMGGGSSSGTGTNLVGAGLGYMANKEALDMQKQLMQMAIDSDQWRQYQPQAAQLYLDAASKGIGNTAYGQQIASDSARKMASMGYNMSGNQMHSIAQNLNRGTVDYLNAMSRPAMGNGPSNAPTVMAPGMVASSNGQYNAIGAGVQSVDWGKIASGVGDWAKKQVGI